MKVDTRVDNKKYGLASESKVWCAAHPVLRHKLTKLRDERTDSRVFRQLLREVTFYLGYDATDDLETTPKKIKTPKGDHQGAELSTSVAIVPILRAGLGMVDPMLDLLPNATVHHIGMYRNKQSLLPVQYYNKLPKECNVDVAIILEPVIATAGTILATLAVLKTWGVEKIKIVSTIASKQGLQEVCAKNPDVEIFLAAIDDDLSEDGYILPGLGDAGDREFQTGVQLKKVEQAHKKQKLAQKYKTSITIHSYKLRSYKIHSEKVRTMTKEVATPPLLKTRSKDPLESSWRKHMSDGQWVPDVSVDTCMLCRAEFSFWIRRHHCRRCGAVVCDGCSGSRTKFIYKEITPNKLAEEDCRVCDACIRVIDEKLALGVSRRFGKGMSAALAANESDNQKTHDTAPPLEPDKSGNRTVMTMGRYRAEIKESEGNRYIRDTDL